MDSNCRFSTSSLAPYFGRDSERCFDGKVPLVYIRTQFGGSVLHSWRMCVEVFSLHPAMRLICGPQARITTSRSQGFEETTRKLRSIMQTTSVFLAAVLVVAAAAAEHPRTPRTYKIDIQPGWNLIANQVDIGNNSISEVLPPSSLQFGSAVYVWADSVWSAELLVDDWIPGVAFLPPGTGFLLYYTGEDPIKLTFTGTWHEPQLPLPIEPDHWYLVACQEPKPACYQDIVGLDPVPGVEIWIRFLDVFSGIGRGCRVE